MTRCLTAFLIAGAMILSGCWGTPAGPASSTRAHHLRARSASDAPQPEAPPQLPAEPALSDYLSRAALSNPGLAAAFNRWKAALEQIPQVRSLPDPKFTYAYYIREVETRVGPQRNSLQIAQTFPWFGKLALRGGAAWQAAEAERQNYEARKLAVFREVKDAYYEYYYLGRAIAVATENVRLLRHLENVVRAKYRAGGAGHPDLIRLQVELGKLEDRLRSLKAMRSPVMAALAAATNLPADRELPWPAQIEPASLEADDAALTAWALESSPKLKARNAEIARRRAQIALARREYYPDVTFGLTWIDTADRVGTPRPSDSGEDPLIAMVSVNLPIWWDKISAGVREAKFRHLAAVTQRADDANRLVAAVKGAAYHCRDAQAKLDLYQRVLIPKARESLKVTEAAFRSGKADFGDLIDAQRVLLEFQLTSERALADRAKRLAEVEMLVGRDLRAPAPPAKPAQ